MSEASLLNNRYQLEKTLGSGGMAVVYRAMDRMLERPVAIKVLREDYSRDEAFRERFRQEARAAANLSHPNIVTVHDFGMDSGRLFIVMEHVPGATLSALLQARGRFTVEETLPLIIQACAGIGYAHRAGLVHCDVKPHNFLITPDNRLKVTDFGIARALASIRPDEKSSVVWGSPQYFAPEQAAGGAPSPASDVYSIGVVLFYMLTGRLPFTAATSEELGRLHRYTLPPSPSEFNPAISTALEKVVLKVLAKEPSARYRTADQLGRVLITLSQNRPAASHPAADVTTVSPINQEPNHSYTTRPASPATQPILNPSQPAPGELQAKPRANQPDPIAEIDWGVILLALGATIAVGGLLPLWLWVYLLYFPPTP